MTDNLAHMPKPQKPQRPRKKPLAVAAQEAETDDGFVTIEQRGVTLRVPVRGKLPVAAIDAFRAGDSYEGTKQMVGEQQWKLLSDAGMTLEELTELGDKLSEFSGN